MNIYSDKETAVNPAIFNFLRILAICVASPVLLLQVMVALKVDIHFVQMMQQETEWLGAILWIIATICAIRKHSHVYTPIAFFMVMWVGIRIFAQKDPQIINITHWLTAALCIVLWVMLIYLVIDTWGEKW